MKTIETIGPLFTDLYQLTMAAGYFENGMHAPATFSLFTRPHPKRSYFVAAGLEEALTQLERFKFTADDLSYLESLSLFDRPFLDHLANLSFEGEAVALPEGTVFFGSEPIMEVTAPIIQAQLVETYLINVVGNATLIATKAARCIQAAAGRPVIDFALRRTQGISAGMTTARSSYLAGFAATSNVLAGKRYGLPVSGTMAHSYVTAFDNEPEAFRAYARRFPDNSVFLIDTYDTLQGARNAAAVALEMRQKGHALKGVRLDSGDMADLSRKVRRILDQAGLTEVNIFASSGFDEYQIETLLADGALIDAFGVGTKMGVSADAPYIDMVYKLVHFDARNIRKYSPGKVTLAGKKQLFRRKDKEGNFREDIIGKREEHIQNADPLLLKVMENGRSIVPSESLETIRDRCRRQLKSLPADFKKTEIATDYPVSISTELAAIQ